MPERDPLQELRAAWNALEAPAAPDDWRDTDPRTRATVEWMRAAWRDVRPARRARPPVRDFRPWRAAAAALVVGTALSMTVQREVASPAELTAPQPEITVAAVEPDRLEIVSGPVRLIWLTPTNEEESQ